MSQHYDMAPASMNLYDTLAQHKRPMMWTFSLIMLLTIAVTFLAPRKFASEAKLFVRLGRESVAMDPTATATTDQVVMVHESREYEINSVLELLKSRAVLSGVVSGVGPLVVLGREPGGDSNTHTAGLLAIDPFKSYSVDDEALRHLNENLEMEVVKKSNIISLAYEADSPELAQQILQSVIGQAHNAHVRVHRTDGSHDFFITQAAQLRDKVTGLETELRDKKNSWGIASLEDQRALMLGRISNLRSSLMQTEATLRSATAEAEAHEAILKTIPEKITAAETSNMPNSAVSSMREQLFIAQVREKEILSRFTKEHPQAIAAAEQIAALEAVIKEEPLKPQVALEPNATHQEINLALLKGTSSAASLSAHAKALREQLSTAENELADFNNKEVEISRLERDIEIESVNYKRYAESVEQARIDQELMTSNISNLNVLQQPTISVTPTSPRRKFNLAVGFIVAMASSLCVGLMLEQRRSGFLFRFAPPLTASGHDGGIDLQGWHTEMPASTVVAHDNPTRNAGD
jgi:uncharacterized protein involved in exopolysaccharide biosynthesis